MDKITIDILLLSLFLISLLVGIRAFWKSQFKLALLMIFGIAFMMRAYQINNERLGQWDECYHALVAKNLAKHPATPTLYDTPALITDDTEWTGSRLWLSKPPVPLWAMGASISIFGTNTFAVRFPSLVVGILSVLLTFLLARRFFDEKIALIAAFLHAINGLVIAVAAGQESSDHVETFFIFFVQAGIYFSILSIQKEKAVKFLLLAGLCTGLAFLSKWFPALLVWPVWLVAFAFSGKFNWKKMIVHALIIGAVTFIVVLPWILRLNRFGDDILVRVLFAFVEPVQLHENPVYYYWHQIMIIFGEAVYLAIIITWAKVFKKRDLDKLTFLLTWLFIPLIIFTMGETKRHTYLLVAAPAVFILIAYSVRYLMTVKKQNMVWIARLGIVLLLLLPIRYMIERTHLLQQKVELTDFYNVPQERLDEFSEKDVVFNLEEHIELMFFSDVGSAYRHMPSDKEIIGLGANQLNVYIYNEGEFELVVD